MLGERSPNSRSLLLKRFKRNRPCHSLGMLHKVKGKLRSVGCGSGCTLYGMIYYEDDSRLLPLLRNTQSINIEFVIITPA